jgi:hypothetical protein
MNEHTKALFDKALDQAVPETWTTLSHEQMMKLSGVFVELIVRECMSNLYLHGYDDAMIQIQKHFGVEE